MSDHQQLGLPFPAHFELDDDDVVESVEVIAEEEERQEPATTARAAESGRVSGVDGVGTRRESRERALSLLYEAEQRQVSPPAKVLEHLPVAPEAFAGELVQGVSDNLSEVDEIIREFSDSWPLERMPAIDRALLRLGVYEICWTGVPTGAVISEAIELAKRYSTDDSHRFVNGMLARIADLNR